MFFEKYLMSTSIPLKWYVILKQDAKIKFFLLIFNNF
jgi:hypothetical protein